LTSPLQEAKDTAQTLAASIMSEGTRGHSHTDALFAALAAPKEALWIASKGQIDFYDDPNIINPAADAVARFFEKWL